MDRKSGVTPRSIPKNLTRGPHFFPFRLTGPSKRSLRRAEIIADDTPRILSPSPSRTRNVIARRKRRRVAPRPATAHRPPARRTPGFLNPLTSFPAPAHRVPRTPSPEFPGAPHHPSRKASPDAAGSPARQGFAKALTSLTGINGVYFYYSQHICPASRCADNDFTSVPRPNDQTNQSVKHLTVRERMEKTNCDQSVTSIYSLCFTKRPGVSPGNRPALHPRGPLLLPRYALSGRMYQTIRILL
jgi:hypothetical protein